MAYWILVVLVYSRIQTANIHVLDFLQRLTVGILGNFVVQFDSVGTTAVEG